ncbi:MAG: aminotransferase class I/II-fold pyridoxal phosphate-dependent enzyme, partial [Chloroflexi bacterium]|nr:aminotransferase class I/II-fold pyridoxal phosphate-dependent enzyme [Chloroflexota bacterium]
MPVPWLDLSANYLSAQDEFDEAIRRVLRSGNVSMGPDVYALEDEFAVFCGRRRAISLGSGSAAILLTLRALGIGPGDEVITAPTSCPSVPTAITHSGARLVFADIQDGSANIDPAQVEARITPLTRAVVAVHANGVPCDMAALAELARQRGLLLVEDGSVATGARFAGRRVGAFGDAAVFSLGHGKVLSSYGNAAGMMTTDSEEVATAVRTLATYGAQPLPPEHDIPADFGPLDHACGVLGYNSHVGSLQAAVLRIQLRRLDAALERRRAIAARYRAGLQGLPVRTLEIPR